MWFLFLCTWRFSPCDFLKTDNNQGTVCYIMHNKMALILYYENAIGVSNFCFPHPFIQTLYEEEEKEKETAMKKLSSHHHNSLHLTFALSFHYFSSLPSFKPWSMLILLFSPFYTTWARIVIFSRIMTVECR